MKYKLLGFFALLCTIVCLPFIGQVSAQSQDIQGSNTYFANLDGVIDFAPAEDKTYLAYNDAISVFDTSSCQTTQIREFDNIEQIYYVNSNIIVITSSDIYAIDSANNILTFVDITEFDSVDVSYADNKYVIAYTFDSKLYVNQYSTPATLTSSINIDISNQEYLISIQEPSVYLINKSNDEVLNFDYVNNHLTEITNISFTSINKFITTQSHFIVVMTDAISIIDNSQYTSQNYMLKRATSERGFISGEIDTVKSIKYYNNKIYILDSTNLCIQSFDIVNNTLANAHTELGSFGGDEDRFFNVNSIALKSSSALYVSDYGNSRIKLINDNTSIIANNPAKSLILDEYDNLIFFTTNSSSTTIFIKSLSTETQTEYEFESIAVDMCIDNSNTLYILTADGIIYKTVISSFSPSQYLNLSEQSITFNNNSKINYLASKDAIILSTNNTIYNLDSLDNHAISDDILDFVCDTSGNIYILTTAGNIHRYNFDSDVVTVRSGFENNTCIALDQLDGSIYTFDASLSNIRKTVDTSFSSGMGNFEHYNIDFFDSSACNYIYNYALLDGLIFEYPNFIGKSYNTDRSISKVVLVNSERSTTGFEYVMFEYNGSLKLGYAKTSDLNINQTPITQSSSNIVVLEDNVKCYKHPSLNSPVVLSTFNKSEVVNTYTNYPTTLFGKNYFIVQTADGFGYIYSGDVTAFEPSYNHNVNIDNAHVASHDHTDSVAVYNNESKDSVVANLEQGKRIYVMDYNKSSEMTLIKYLDNDGKEKMGYVETKYVHMDSNKAIIISAIVTLILGLIAGTILIVYYVKYKKNNG